MVEPEHGIGSLRQQAHRAVRDPSSRAAVERLLHRLARRAEPVSADALFAHHHLAECLVLSHPWRAALHARQALRIAKRNPDARPGPAGLLRPKVQPQEVGAVLPPVQAHRLHAVMGLSQTLLGNYRFAVQAYRHASAAEPDNPWYFHNIGHLLDVALDRPRDAFFYLESAHRLEPDNSDICASLAHCLTRLGDYGKARALALDALVQQPDSRAYQRLAAWVDAMNDRAQDDVLNAGSSGVDPAASIDPADGELGDGSGRIDKAGIDGGLCTDDVGKLLAVHMSEAGCSDELIDASYQIWVQYRRVKGAGRRSPAANAAACEWACRRSLGRSGVSRAQIAERYGVSLNALVQSHRCIAAGLKPVRQARGQQGR